MRRAAGEDILLFAGVDPIAVEDIQSIVYKLKDKNIGILITDHNAQETLRITDRAYLLFEGRSTKACMRRAAGEDILLFALRAKDSRRRRYLCREDRSLFYRKKLDSSDLQ